MTDEELQEMIDEADRDGAGPNTPPPHPSSPSARPKTDLWACKLNFPWELGADVLAGLAGTQATAR